MRARNSEPPALSNSVSDIRRGVLLLQRELDTARREAEALRREVEARRRSTGCGHDLRRLRRKVALLCHPDRGGSDLLMRRLNALFDTLEQQRVAA